MDEHSAFERAKWVVAAGASVLGVLMAAHLLRDGAIHAAPWTNNDTAFFTYIAGQMRDGARLYIDWQDNDPPSVFWLTSAAVRIGGLLDIPGIVVYHLFALVAAAAGLFVLVHSLTHLGRRWPALVLASAGYLFFVGRPATVARHFGQREHFFALLLIPEVFALVGGARPRWRPIWCAALAFMAMMKPQFLATLALLELTAPRGTRWRLEDLAGFAVGGAAPFALLWWHSAASFRALFVDTLDVHLSGAYALLNQSPALLLGRGPLVVLAATLAALALLALVVRQDGSVRGLAWRMTLAVVCCALAVINQQKYAPYHFTPVLGFAIVGGSWAMGEWLAMKRHAVLASSAAVAIALAGAAIFHVDVSANGDPAAVRLGRIVGGHPRLLVESVYLHGLCTPFREAPQCIGPQAYTVRLPQMARAADSRVRLQAWASTVAAQVNRYRPELIALSTSDSAMPEGLTPASLLREQFPSVPPDQYVPLSPAAMTFFRAGGWLILRRHDVPERLVGAD